MIIIHETKKKRSGFGLILTPIITYLPGLPHCKIFLANRNAPNDPTRQRKVLRYPTGSGIVLAPASFLLECDNSCPTISPK